MNLNFKTFGNGPALIILHGLFGSLDNWITHARALSDEFSVYIIDQRNHGKSPHASEWDYPTMADDLEEFLDQQGIYQAHILGHSMGGKTVMQFATAYPERVGKLIVADMAPFENSARHHHILEAMNAVPLQQIAGRKEAEAILEGRIKEIGIRQFLLKGLGRDENKNFSWKFNLKLISEKYENILAALDMEGTFDGDSLFIYGGKSDYVAKDLFPAIQEYFPEAVFYKIEEAGHWLHAEVPQEFISKVRSFLAGETL
ncbi:MAG: alpha/beta fold hydrolase [Bacteroidota bacterium]